MEKVTSHSAATGGSVVNQVQNVYSTARQLTTQYQEHNGAVNTGTSVKAQYAYDTTATSGVFTKGLRLTTLTYPNSTALAYQYGSGGSVSDKLARVNNLSFGGTNVCQYTYLGLGSFVQVDYGQPDIRYDLATGSSPNPYTGLDRFGRIIDLLWQKYSVAVYIKRLRQLGDQLNPRAVVTVHEVPPQALPSYVLEHKLAKVQRGATRVSGSNLGDGHIAPLVFYADGVEVDKRTFEYLTQLKRTCAALGSLMGHYFRSSDYTDIPDRCCDAC